MHDKFEKEVQGKMEELRLTPSAPVWEKIELEIRPEKKRRRVIFWLFFGVLLAGGAFLTYQLTGGEQPDNRQAVVTNQKQTTNQEEKTKHEETISNRVENPVNQINRSVAETTHPGTEQTQQTNISNQKIVSLVSSPQATKVVLPNKKRSEKKQRIITGQSPQQTTTANNSSVGGTVTKETPPAASAKEELTKQDNIPAAVEKPTQTDSAAKEPGQKTEIPKAVDSLVKRKLAKTGWQKQVTVSLGHSSYKDPLLSPSGRFAMDATASPNAPPVGNGGVPVYYRPAETKGGFAFTAGLSLAKKLNDHFEIAIGLQYAYSSSQTKVGGRSTAPSQAGSFSSGTVYANTATAYYTNRFHAAEIPVTVSYKPSVSLPLYLSAGAAYGQLLSTNALTFSNRNNLYFEDKENYVRNMLPVSASAQVELFGKKKIAMRIGPVVKYNLLKLQKETAEGERHLFFAGITSSLNF